MLAAALAGLSCTVACAQPDGSSATTSLAALSSPPKPRLPLVDKADILFVIDNSNSMADEQGALRAQFPRLITALTHGERFPGDPRPFAPVHDLHIGVVSTDMGTPGFAIQPSCRANGGDDGRLQHTPAGSSDGQACATQYPAFLSADIHSQADIDQLSHDFGCVAQIGIGGCGFEQQLEAPLKALWPATYHDSQGRVVQPNPVVFAAATPGHGDEDPAHGGNSGFLRDALEEPSLLVIVVVTDEDDCSTGDLEILKPANLLPPDSPFRSQPDLNLRCFHNEERLYDVVSRYLNGFRALRPGHEELVVFSAIVGVPPDLVDQAALARADWSDEPQRAEFYATLLNDPRMQQVVDPETKPGMGMGNLTPACRRLVDAEPPIISTAYPARRIVSLAQAFGEHGLVQSICQDDFGPAVDSILEMMSRSLTPR